MERVMNKRKLESHRPHPTVLVASVPLVNIRCVQSCALHQMQRQGPHTPHTRAVALVRKEGMIFACMQARDLRLTFGSVHAREALDANGAANAGMRGKQTESTSGLRRGDKRKQRRKGKPLSRTGTRNDGLQGGGNLRTRSIVQRQGGANSSSSSQQREQRQQGTTQKTTRRREQREEEQEPRGQPRQRVNDVSSTSIGDAVYVDDSQGDANQHGRRNSRTLLPLPDQEGCDQCYRKRSHLLTLFASTVEGATYTTASLVPHLRGIQRENRASGVRVVRPGVFTTCIAEGTVTSASASLAMHSRQTKVTSQRKVYVQGKASLDTSVLQCTPALLKTMPCSLLPWLPPLTRISKRLERSKRLRLLDRQLVIKHLLMKICDVRLRQPLLMFCVCVCVCVCACVCVCV